MPAWVPALSLALLSAPSVDEARLRVTIEGEPGCIDSERVVEAAIERFDDQRWQPVQMQVWLDEAPNGGHAARYRLESAAAVGRGQVVTTDCATLTAVLAIKLGLAAVPGRALDLRPGPHPLEGTWEPAATESAVAASDTERPLDAPPTEAPTSMARPRLPQIRLGSGAGVMLGGLGPASGRFELGAALAEQPWVVELYGTMAVAPTTRLDDAITRRLRSYGAGLRGCAAARWRRLEIPACLGMEAATVRIDVAGLPQGGVGHEPWVVAAAHVRPQVAITRRVGLWLATMAGVSLRRPAFSVTGLGTVFRSDSILLTATAGISIAIAGPTTDPRGSVQ
ncbi:MAG: hypothetical protein AAF799_02355 [Myxococcota bacterium]